ncbi:alpha/beta fold hydrolase [Lentzea sp. NPDC051838]|uniref:alpha/beta fold hydrolase n=1 Tax=Lentzea sp. NPDC051838 TaxID=3154849 RepID=UPI00342A2170
MKRVLAVLVSAAVLSGTGVATAGPRIGWLPCEKAPASECATLTVPVDHSRPLGDEFGLAIARHKADPAKRIGTLVAIRDIADSGVDLVADPGAYFSPAIVERFDIVAMDTRGNERSRPITCSLDLLRAWPSGFPKTRAEFDGVLDFNQRLRDDCRANSGPIFDHVSSADVARDVEAIRKALGERQISLYTTGYATITGQQYAERYGSHLRALVLDTAFDHSMNAERYVTSAARSAAGAFAEWEAWNTRTPSSPLHGRDIGKFWDDLAAQADSTGLVDPRYPDWTMDQQAFSSGFFGLGSRGDFTALSNWALSLKPASQQRIAADQAVNYPFNAMICNDYDYRHQSFADYQRLTALETSIAPHTRGMFHPHNTVIECSGHPKPSNPQRPVRVTSGPKILVTSISNPTWSATEWASSVRDQLGDRAVLATYEGVHYGFYESGTCGRAVNDDYLIALKVPADGTKCSG